MKCVNRVILLGNVTHDPEVKKTPADQTVCSFGLATNREWKDQKGDKQSMVEFHHLVAWGKLGEFCGQYVRKGKPLYVEGHLKTGTWEKPAGTKHQRTEVVLDDVTLLGSRDKNPEPERQEAVAA